MILKRFCCVAAMGVSSFAGAQEGELVNTLPDYVKASIYDQRPYTGPPVAHAFYLYSEKQNLTLVPDGAYHRLAIGFDWDPEGEWQYYQLGDAQINGMWFSAWAQSIPPAYGGELLRAAKPGDNTVLAEVWAYNQNNEDIPPTSFQFELPIWKVFAIPEWLENGAEFLSEATYTINNWAIYHFSMSFPPESKRMTTYVDLPLLGSLGMSLGFETAFEYIATTHEWALYTSVQDYAPRPGSVSAKKGGIGGINLSLFQRKISGGVEAEAEGYATLGEGIQLNKVSVGLTMSGDFEVGRYGVLNLIPPLAYFFDSNPWIKRKDIEPLSLTLYLKPSVDVMVPYDVPAGDFMPGEASFTGIAEAELLADIYIAKVSGTLGAKLKMDLELNNGVSIDDWSFYGYFTFKASALGIYSAKRTYRYPAATKGSGARQAAAPPFLSPAELHPLERAQGEAQKLLSVAGKTAGLAAAGDDEVLVENILPASECALASRGGKRMLVYVADSGAEHALQFTDVHYLYHDGTDWSDPAPISTDARAEMMPKVAFDNAGNAIAVWMRVKDAAFSAMDLGLLSAQLEIVWSRWDVQTGVWSVPVALTNNAYADSHPQLAGPLNDGRLVLTWTENAGNALPGTVASPNKVLSKMWTPGTQTWSSVVTVAQNIYSQTSQALAARGARAAYVWTQDADGNDATETDTEVFVSRYRNGTWQASQLTFDNRAASGVKVAFDSTNSAQVIWKAAGQLWTCEGLFDATPWMGSLELPGTMAPWQWDTEGDVEATGEPSGPPNDFWMGFSPDDELALVWQDTKDGKGSCLVKAVYHYDESLGYDSWGRAKVLSARSGVPKSVAVAWDDEENLGIASVSGTMMNLDREVELDDGSTEMAEDIPTETQVDLLFLSEGHGVDLTVNINMLRLPTEHENGYSAITIKNVGSMGSPGTKVALYDGLPEEEGVQLLGVWDVEALPVEEFFYPHDLEVREWGTNLRPNFQALVAVIDPYDEVEEVDETNNRYIMDLSEVDLVLSKAVEDAHHEDDSVSVTFHVDNVGGSPSGASVLTVTRTSDGQVVATVPVPVIARMGNVILPVTLPAGFQNTELVELTATLTGGEAEKPEFLENNTVTFGTVKDFSYPGATKRPIITGNSVVYAEQGASFQHLVQVLNAPTSFTSTGLPETLSLHPTSGVISGTPLVRGRYAVQVTVENEFGGSSKDITLIVGGPLDDSLDQTGLTWTTGGNGTWYGQTETTVDNTDAAESMMDRRQGSTWLETTVTGPTTLTYKWRLASTDSRDTLTLLVDGTAQRTLKGLNTSWTEESVHIPAGTHTLRWRHTSYDAGENTHAWVDLVELSARPVITNREDVYPLTGEPFTHQILATNSPTSYSGLDLPDGIQIHPTTGLITGTFPGAGYYSLVIFVTNAHGTSSATIQVLVAPPLEQATDSGNLVWTTGGAAKWYYQTAMTSDSVDALRSGKITHGQTTWVETTVTGPGTLTFDWRASSESKGEDPATFSVDGVPQWSIWGEWDSWDTRSYDIPEGEHVLRWSYTKDGAFSSGTDAAWLDKVEYSNLPELTIDSALQIERGTTVNLQITATNSPLSYNVTGLPTGLTATSAGLITGTPTVTGHYLMVVVATNALGTSTTEVPFYISPTLAESVDAISLTWTSGGTRKWFGQDTVTADGFDAAQSGLVTDDQKSWIQTTVTGPGTLTYEWRVSSEEDFDFLRLDVGGTETKKISGTSEDWLTETVNIGSGAKTLRWTYEKDEVVSDGEDAGWLDMVTFIPTVTLAAWKESYWPGQTGSAAAADMADPDHDGLANVLEYALQLDPTGVSTSGRPALGRQGENLSLTFNRMRGNVTYNVEQSINLHDWAVVSTNPGTLGSSVTVEVPMGSAGMKFLRLRVVMGP